MKTRLAAEVGETAAAALAEAFLEDALDLAAALAARGVAATVVYTPDAARARFERRAAGRGLGVEPQGEGDLGARLARALAEALAEGARGAVAIGSDAPELALEHVLEAFEALELGAGAVLGPCPDGGFYLAGVARKEAAHALAGPIAWSTERALADTICSFETAGLSVARLAPLADVDDGAALRALAARLRAGNARARPSATARELDTRGWL